MSMPDKREQLYNNLIGSGKVSEREIGTLDQFRNALKDEKDVKTFYNNLCSVFSREEIGTAEAFYGALADDFKPLEPDLKQALPDLTELMAPVETTKVAVSIPQIDVEAPGEKPVEKSNGNGSVKNPAGAVATFLATGPLGTIVNKKLQPEEETSMLPPGFGNQSVFEKQLDKSIRENAQKVEKDKVERGIGSYVLDAATWLTNPVLGAESMVADYYMNQPESYRDRKTAGKFLGDAKDLQEMAKAEKEQHAISRFATSFGRSLWDPDTATMGATELDDNIRMIAVGRKFDKKGYNGLSPSEQELLEAAAIKMAAQVYYGKNIGVAQRAGQSTAVSIPYMLQFMLTSGVGTAATTGVRRAVLAAAKKMLQKGVNKTVAKIGSGMVYNVAKAAAMTPVQPALYTDISRRLAGNAGFGRDREGTVYLKGLENRDNLGMAIAKGYGATTIENYSEMSGELLQGLGKLVSTFGKRVPKLGGVLSKVEQNELISGFNKFSKTAGWHGTPGEYFEEQVSTALNALMVGDNKLSDLIDKQQQGATFLSVAAFGGMLAAGNAGVAAPVKRRIRENYAEAENKVKGLFDGVEYDRFRQSLSNLTLEQRPFFVDRVVQMKGLDKEQVDDLCNYMVRQAQYEGYLGGIRDRVNEESVKAQDEIRRVSNPLMGVVMTVETPLSDNPVHIVGGYLSVDEEGVVDPARSSQAIYYLDREGKRQMASPDKFEKLVRSDALDDLYAQALTGITDRIVGEEESVMVPFKNRDVVTTKDGMQGVVTDINVDEREAYVYLSNGRYEHIPFDDLRLVEPDVVAQPAEGVGEGIMPNDKVGMQPAEGVANLPDNELSKSVFPLTKEGGIDYSQISEPRLYADALTSEFGEEAPDALDDKISELEGALERAQKVKDAYGRRRAVKKIKGELEYLKSVRPLFAPVQSEVQNVDGGGIPSGNADVSEPVVSLENLSDKEYAEWALDESDSSDELLDAYEIARESAKEGKGLLPWQRELLGKKINPASFYRFGDRNVVNGLFARAWLKKDGYQIDTYADELSELGVRVTPEDVVDFMLSNPTNYVRKTSDLQRALAKRWAEVASKEAGVPIGNPESATGRVFIAMKKKGGIISPVVYEEAVQADYFREDEKMVEDLFGKPVEKNQEDGIQNDEEAAWTPEDYQEIYEAIDKELNVSKNEKEGTGFETSDTRTIDSETGREVGTGGDPDGKADYTGENRTSAGRDGEAGFDGDGRVEADGEAAGVVTEPSVVAGRETPLETIERVAAEQNKRDAVASAEKEVDVHPTEAQKEAGNYKKGHVKVNGFDITIEQPAGSIRSGKDASGKEWSVRMNNTYGYFKGTKGKDGDHIDVFLGRKLDSDKVFVVDQVNPDGSFDEHKVMMGFDSVDEAKKAYLSNYEEGWQGLGSITPVSLDEFKEWVASSKRKIKPFADYRSVKENAGEDGLLFRAGDNFTPEEREIVERAKADGTYLKAPNGNNTNLNPKQWVQVRTKAFKEWFGDWEKATRIEKLRKSEPVEITGSEITPSDDLKQYKKNALEYGKNLRGQYTNRDTGISISVTGGNSRGGIREILQHDYKDTEHLQSIAAIPKIIENSIFIEELPNEDFQKYSGVKSFSYYVCGLKIGGVDYTVKAIIANQNNGERYYDHKLTEIEKGELLSIVPTIQKAGIENNSPLSNVKDIRLLSILQTNSSKVVDENGEPLVVYHGSLNDFNIFDYGKIRATRKAGFYFTKNKDLAKNYQKGGKLIEAFVNLRKPLNSDETKKEVTKELFVEIANEAGIERDMNKLYDIADSDIDLVSFLISANNDIKAINDALYTVTKYDGIITEDRGLGKSYIAFSPNQIKSATDNTGEFSIDNDDIRYRKTESGGLTNQDKEDNVVVSKVNERFNEELQQQIEGTLPKGHVYALGKPGVALLSSGIPDLPIELAASRLEGKSRQENHPFELSEIKNLPEAIQNPLAVFRSATHIGSFVVMTEIEHKGKNFVVAIEANRKRGKIEVNSIRSVHYRTTNAHMANWINEGLLEYVDKQRMSVWLSKQRYNSADVRQLYGHSTKIVNSFDNPTFVEGKKIAEVKNLSSELNTPVRIVRDVNNLPEDARKRRAKGYYDPKTGETVIVLPNNTDVADVQKTLLHEIVAHKGLRGLLGDKLDDMLDRVFAGLPEKQRAVLAREAYSEYKGNVRVATEEYLARIAEKDIQPTVWEKVKSAIRDFFRSLGIELRMTDADIQYLLWKSKNRLKRDGSMLEIVENVARDADMKERLYREDKPGKEKEPLVSPEQLAREKPIDQARIVNEALELSEEEKNDFSKKIKHDRLREGWQDRFIPVLRFQELIAKKFGRPIKDFCNAYIFENTIASRSTYEIERYKQMYLRPLLDIVARLGGQDKVANYMKAKHGLERNEVMRARAIERRRAKLESRYEALEESLKNKLSELENQNGVSQAKINSYADSIRETLQKEKERMEESMAKYEQRQAGTDYSGLTGLQQKLSGEKNALNEGYIRDFVDAFEKDHNVKPLWDAIRKSTRFSLEKQYLSGCIDKKTLDHISGMYEYYIPLREWEEDTAEDFYDYFFKEGKDTLNDPLKKTKGRKSEAGDPFANIASMASSAIFIGNKNLMKQHFLRLVTNYKTNLATVSDSWYIYEKDVDGSGVPGWREVRPEFREDMTEEEQQEVVEEFNARMKELQQDGLARTELSGLDLGVPIKPYQAEQHVIKVKENGVDKLIFIQGNPRVAQAINGLNNVRAYDSSLLKAMSNIKQFMTQNFTTRNPTFVARNLSRDMIYAVTMHGIREGGAYTTEFLKAIPGASGAIARYLRGKANMSNEMDKMFEEFLRNGGETGFVALTSYETYKKEIRRMVNKAARTNALADSWEAIGKAFEGCNRWAEDLSRFATYVASRKAGRSVMRSVSDAKEVTVNFNRKGSGAYGGWIGNLCYFFLNAGMQGMHNFGRTFKARPVKTTFAMTAWAMLGALMPDLISLLYGDDEDYNNIPDHVRQNSIVIPMGGGYYFAVPLSIEVRAFYGIGDIVRQIVKGNYNDRATDAASDIMERLMDLTPRNFIGNSDDGGRGVIGAIASNAVPDVLKPFVEAYVTNSDFTGRPIVKDTEYNKYEPEYQRVYKGTAKELLASSEFINQISGGDYATKGWADSPWLNPAAVEHLFESYFGGVGKTIMQTKKTIASPWTGDFALRNVPVVSGFTYELNPAYPNTAINERYQVYTDLIKEMQSRERMYDKGMMAGEPLDKNYKAFMNSRDWKVAEIAQSYKELIDGIGKEANLAKDKKDKERLYAEITGLKKKMLEQIDNVK